MSNECIHTHSNLAKSGIWSIDCEIWDMGNWGVKNLGYGILGVKNLGYGILGRTKSGIWDMGTPVSSPPLLLWGLYIMRGTGREQWFGVAQQRHVVGVGDCRLTGGGLLRWQEGIREWGVYS